MAPWRDNETDILYNSTKPVRAIFGIEADCPTDTDTYWRMGYTNPVQLTQWALASAPGHPALTWFIQKIYGILDEVASHHDGNLTTPEAYEELDYLEPLLFTGPDAITVSMRSWLEDRIGLRWNALTGLHDNGKSKLADDIMILPITGFRYVSLCIVLLYSQLLTITAPVAVYTATWARNQLRITTHVSNILPRAPGKDSISASNSAKYAEPFLACVETGPSHDPSTIRSKTTCIADQARSNRKTVEIRYIYLFIRGLFSWELSSH